MTNKIQKIFILIILLTFFSCKNKQKNSIVDNDLTKKPNIVFIYMDDLGYGDVGYNGAKGIKTPNIDKLASNGVTFTNGYATSATCTPSRYALLTGKYPWRNKKAKILPGTAPLLINSNQMTIPKMLQTKGYYTGIVGKWHLGLGNGNVNWNKTITPNPNDIGFDYSYIMAATQDRVPTVYIENGNVVNLDSNDPIEVNYDKNFEGQPTGKNNPELLKLKWHHGHNSSIVNGIPRIGYMKGGESAKWVDEDMADHFLQGAQSFIKQHKNQSFFLYYPMQQPHVPRTPHRKFIGKSGLGPRGDVIMEADWCVGQLIHTLEKEGVLDNTLIVFTSDNGPVLNDGYFDQAEEKIGNHDQNGGLRGGKYSLFEAGTRVPFFTYWKGKIQPKISDALVCQLDLFASIAKLIDSDEKATDSQQLLDVFMGKSNLGRKNLIIEATSRTAFRQGDWAMIPPYNKPRINTEVNIELGNDTMYQLYNIKKDKAQQYNLAFENKEKLQEMIIAFEAIRGKDYKKSIRDIELK